MLGFQFQDVPADEFARNERELRDLLSTGRVTPHVGATYPLTERWRPSGTSPRAGRSARC